MYRIGLVVFSILALASSNPAIFSKNKETSNEVSKNEPTKTDEKILDNLKKVMKVEEAVDALFLKTESGTSRSHSSSTKVEARKKSKIKKTLKKFFLPVIIFIVIKAVVLLPLAVSTMGFTTWTIYNISFYTFAATLTIAFWKFFSTINNVEPPKIVQAGWELDRSDSHALAYNGYVPQK